MFSKPGFSYRSILLHLKASWQRASVLFWGTNVHIQFVNSQMSHQMSLFSWGLLGPMGKKLCEGDFGTSCHALYSQETWSTIGVMTPNFFLYMSLYQSSPYISHTNSELGHVTCFGQRNNSNCDRSRDLKNTQILVISLIFTVTGVPATTSIWKSLG